MTKIVLTRPSNASRILPLGAPVGEYFSHDFPLDIGAAELFNVTLSGVDKQLLNVVGLGLVRPKRPRKQKRLARSTEIELEFSPKVKPIRLFVKMDSSLVFVYGRIDSPIVLAPELLVPRSSTLTTFYDRTGGRKVIHAYYQAQGHPVIDIHLALEKYSEFFTIDTNCWNVKGIGTVAATTAIRSSARVVSDNSCFVSSDMLYQDVAINPDGNPELHGIWHFLEDLRRKVGNFTTKIALVTDTELSSLRAINQRKLPLFRDYLLPDAFDIHYATGDAGTDEYMPNRLLQECDRRSTARLKDFILKNGRQRERA